MSWVIDIIYVLVILLLIFKYFKSGFTKAILNLAKFIASVILATVFGKLLAPWILEKFLQDKVSAQLATAFSNILAYVIVYLVAYLILSLVIYLLCKIKIPILSFLDKILGVALGILIAALSLSIVSTVLFACLQFIAETKADPEIMNVYNNSYVFKFIYELRIFEFIRNLV